MKHGMSGARIYQTWTNMKARCYKEYDRKYKFYGGKGIKVCDEWLNDFNNFYDWAMQNGYTHSNTIQITRADGRPDVKLQSKWAQKGRLFLYNLLKDNNIYPVIERKAS